jgi:anti-sigma regulatory factor (Ser/Thr protein kinase)
MDEQLELTLLPGPSAASTARNALTRRFSNILTVRGLEDVRLLVTELISNSLRHAGLRNGDRVSLRAGVRDGHVRVEVRDPGRDGPVRKRDPHGRGGGYGLYLVERLSRRWGVERNGGTVVWFELPAAGAR